MQKILVSGCLLGQKVRYDGAGFAVHEQLAQWQAQGRVISICPEMAGGLPTPRAPAEIVGGQGLEVIHGKARVLTQQGADLSAAFIAGAEAAVALVHKHQIKIALLKARSPSCGQQQIYDGTFSSVLIEGQGVSAALLEAAGVRVFNEQQLPQAAEWLQFLDTQHT